MKLKKITAYTQTDGPAGVVITIIPSGCKGVWIWASEDHGYNLGIAYPDSDGNQAIIEAVKEAEIDG